jgi:NAD(P)-dependent dehydrogenase (short-subunit alcohol dehydrogenase family)
MSAPSLTRKIKGTAMLEGKVALVTGAGGGIGRSIAVAMAKAGAAVVINDVGVSLSGEGGSATPAEEVKAEIEALGGTAVISTESVSEWETAKRIVATAKEAFGKLNIVVNNAGILRDALFHKMTPEQWLSVIGVHLNGSFFISRAAAELFREQESGAFVHMTSTSGLVGNIGQANYSAAKMAIVGLSKSIALDMQRFNVRSNCIAPFAWGRMTANIPAVTPDQMARVERLKQMTPEKNAPLAVFLASDEAAEVTGQIFSTRMNEIVLFGQTRPVRSVHRDGGWTPESVRDHAIPALQSSFAALDRSQDVFSWDPV